MEEKEARVLRQRATILKTRKTVLGIEKVLQNSLAYQILSKQKDQKQKIKIQILNKEEDRRKRKRDILEKARNKLALKTGILDSTSNFLANALFGFLFTKILPVLPNLLNVVQGLTPAMKFMGSITNLFLNIIGGFLETGYKVHDSIKKTSDGVTKIPIKKEFDNFQNTLSNSLSSVVNIAYGIIGQKPPTEKAEKKSTKPIKGAAVGGPIGYNPPKRELEKRREIKIPRKQTLPETRIGKDVGGEVKVREFYRSPKAGLGGILGIFKPKNAPLSKSPVDSISNISKTLRRRNLLFGDIASVGSDLALGQKPSKVVYRNTAKDVLQLAQVIADKQQQQSRDSIFAMAYGGTVPSRALSSSSRGDLVDTIALVIQKSVEERVNKAMNDFRRPVGREEMMEETRSRAESGAGSSSDGGVGGGGYSGGLYGGYKPRGSMEKQIYEYLTKEKKLNDIQALGLMANIDRESSFRPNAREKGGTGHGLFQWSHGRVAPFMRAVPDWETNWKAQIDYALNEPETLSLVKPGAYASKTFASAQEAADWWMEKWERPRDKISGSRKHSGYLKGVPKGPTGSAMFRGPENKESGEVEAKSTGFRTGLKTGPEGRIGAGTGYHVDARFVDGLPLKDKVAMLDSMASAHAAEGFVMEFSGIGVGDLRWNPNASQKEKEDLAKRVLRSHHSPRPGYEPFDYFIVKQNVRSRFVGGDDLSVSGIAGANIMAPRLQGGTYEYQEEPGGYGRFLILRDKVGRVIMKVGHGDLGMPSPKEIGRRFNMDALEENSGGLAMKNGKQGIIINGNFKEKKWSNEETNRYKNSVSNKKVEKRQKLIKPTSNKKQKGKPRLNTSRPKKQTARKQPQQNLIQRAKNVFKRITGFKRGGFVGDYAKAISEYAPYEMSSGGVIFAVQPMIIQKESIIEKQIPIAFPMPSGVNNNTNYRA